MNPRNRKCRWIRSPLLLLLLLLLYYGGGEHEHVETKDLNQKKGGRVRKGVGWKGKKRGGEMRGEEGLTPPLSCLVLSVRVLSPSCRVVTDILSLSHTHKHTPTLCWGGKGEGGGIFRRSCASESSVSARRFR